MFGADCFKRRVIVSSSSGFMGHASSRVQSTSTSTDAYLAQLSVSSPKSISREPRELWGHWVVLHSFFFLVQKDQPTTWEPWFGWLSKPLVRWLFFN